MVTKYKDTVEVKPYRCTLCMATEEANYIGNKRMVEKKLCYTCNFWDEWLERRKEKAVVRVGGCHYFISPDSNKPGRGDRFSGQEFKIKFYDGRIVTTHNLWHLGEIPEHFREGMPDNAEFIQGP